MQWCGLVLTGHVVTKQMLHQLTVHRSTLLTCLQHMRARSLNLVAPCVASSTSSSTLVQHVALHPPSQPVPTHALSLEVHAAVL